jgi:hypothetical protein
MPFATCANVQCVVRNANLQKKRIDPEMRAVARDALFLLYFDFYKGPRSRAKTQLVPVYVLKMNQISVGKVKESPEFV